MNAFFKFILFLVLGLVALVVIVAVALPLLINPNDYKKDIEEQVLKHTGRQLNIAGDIDLSLSLPLSVAFELGETQLNNAPGFGDKPFASIKQISVDAAIFPLLKEKKLEIGKILVDQVFINLVRKKDGSSNWDDLAGDKSKSDTNTPKSSPEKDKDKAIPAINIAGIDVINTHLIFDDQLNGQYIELKDLSLSTSSISEQQPITLSFKLGNSRVSSGENKEQALASVKQINIEAKVTPPFEQPMIEVGKVVMEQLQLNLTKDKNGIANWESFNKPSDTSKTKPQSPTKANKETITKKPHKKAAPKVSVAGVAINKTQISYLDQSTGQDFKLNDLSINVSEVIENKPVSINFSSQFASSNLKLDGSLDLKSQATINLQQQTYQIADTTLTLDVKGDNIPGGKNQTQLSADILIDLGKQILHLSKLEFITYDLKLNGEVKAQEILTKPSYNGSLNVADFSPRQMAQNLQIPLPQFKNDKVLNNATLKVVFSGNPNKVKITTLDAKLDDVTLNGNAAINNLSKPAYVARLDINKLHLDDYALVSEEKPNDETQKQPDNAKKQTTKTEQPLIPVELLRQLNIDSQLKIGELLANGVKMTNILLTLKGKDGVVKLDPVKSDFYNGKLNVVSTIDVRKDTPKIKFQQDFKQIDLGQLLQDATQTQEFKGTANISSQITTHGNLHSSLVKNSNGKAKFLITDGHIKKLDILHTLRKAQAVYKREPIPTRQQEANTEFTELKGTMNITNGVIKNNDLASKSPVMSLTGKGYVDLPKEYLDYTLKVQLLNTLSIDEKTEGADYRSYQIPYTIKGKFNELSQQADMKKVLAEQAKQELKKSLKKKLEGKSGNKLKEKLGDGVGKKLEGILKF